MASGASTAVVGALAGNTGEGHHRHRLGQRTEAAAALAVASDTAPGTDGAGRLVVAEAVHCRTSSASWRCLRHHQRSLLAPSAPILNQG